MSSKKGLKPWLQEHWCSPEVSPSFVAAVEDVLELYAEPYNPERPVVGFDERPLQLVPETRIPAADADGTSPSPRLVANSTSSTQTRHDRSGHPLEQNNQYSLMPEGNLRPHSFWN